MIKAYFIAGGMLLAGLSVSLIFGSELNFQRQWQLIGGLEPEQFVDFAYLYSLLPRLTMAVLVGASLGLVGSLMQQLTQNPLLSPLTMGTSSGAWLALVMLNLWLPLDIADLSVAAAMLGAMFAMFLVIAIVGLRNLSGLPVVLAGMAVNIVLGAIATAIILLNEQFATNLFIWGAGDLEQNDWFWPLWLAPRLLPAILIFALAPRVLSLLKLGQQGAAARGLNVVPMFILLAVAGVWLVAASITAVGVISFVGLISPNIARRIGARSPKNELWLSCLIGALLLVLTDLLANYLSPLIGDVVHSGIAAAIVGAPILIILCQRQLRAQDQLSLSLPQSRLQWRNAYYIVAFVVIAIVALLSLLGQHNAGSWSLGIPDAFNWLLRWPRWLTAVSAGAGLAVAGCILQRLIFNPLASPDILGVSAGATMSLVGLSVVTGASIFSASPWVAVIGSTVVLALLFLFSTYRGFSPAKLVLCGIALAALIEGLVHFALASGQQEIYEILAWLAGSTYRVSPEAALRLAVVSLVVIVGLYMLHPWLSLISAGRSFAQARGLGLTRAYLLLLLGVAFLCAMVTATMGPVAFVGLLAPHVAIMLGARLARQQIIVSALVGALLMSIADLISQWIFYPSQVAAGTLVSIIGGGYFIALLVRGQRQARS
ncbi:Fe(3+)-hydroxamate ABC transporter permease FhuB [Agarivorans aestuarii]|uniref:Fe(3+)-hydroxamate ABC transporter permease FhuB n=1 Tax=Agarivorans aestuarii TaxID=1563703 RepID=A0ABU7G3D9_9ALTE|nr:Fe(3+)-hydroxamate ABC transporter permease FhuB [Agarivorans aestuarii]MEE1673000.1 Fe(3+)-hydroxamate ABC transporter permease FhuB [Agarivorans aestuarii]